MILCASGYVPRETMYKLLSRIFTEPKNWNFHPISLSKFAIQPNRSYHKRVLLAHDFFKHLPFTCDGKWRHLVTGWRICNRVSMATTPTAFTSISAGKVSGKNRGDEDDDLEYHVTFPSPTPRTVSSQENDDFVYVGWDDKEPVVMLFGWAGCRDKDLAKYSALYESKGCITVRYLSSAADVMLYRKHKFQGVALKLLELLTDLNLEEHPVIFHTFSNGGCFVYRHVTKFICNDAANRIKVQGCVFDSCPAITTILSNVYAFSATLRGGRPYRMLVTVMYFLYLSVTSMVDYLFSLITKQQMEAFCFGMWQDLSKDALRCPQLFLFSTGDKICQHDSIEKFIVQRKKLGVDAQGICLGDNSFHVRHYTTHPEVYSQEVHSFLEKCLRSTIN